MKIEPIAMDDFSKSELFEACQVLRRRVKEVKRERDELRASTEIVARQVATASDSIGDLAARNAELTMEHDRLRTSLKWKSELCEALEHDKGVAIKRAQEAEAKLKDANTRVGPAIDKLEQNVLSIITERDEALALGSRTTKG